MDPADASTLLNADDEDDGGGGLINCTDEENYEKITSQAFYTAHKAVMHDVTEDSKLSKWNTHLNGVLICLLCVWY